MSNVYAKMNDLELYREILRQSNKLSDLIRENRISDSEIGRTSSILAQNLYAIGYDDEGDEMLDKMSDEYIKGDFIRHLVESAEITLKIFNYDLPSEFVDPTSEHEFLLSARYLIQHLQRLNHPMFDEINNSMSVAKDRFVSKLTQ